MGDDQNNKPMYTINPGDVNFTHNQFCADRKEGWPYLSYLMTHLKLNEFMLFQYEVNIKLHNK